MAGWLLENTCESIHTTYEGQRRIVETFRFMGLEDPPFFEPQRRQNRSGSHNKVFNIHFYIQSVFHVYLKSSILRSSVFPALRLRYIATYVCGRSIYVFIHYQLRTDFVLHIVGNMLFG